MLFTRVRMKYNGRTFDCTNFFSLSMTNQEEYHNSNDHEKMNVLLRLFRSALFGMDQMAYDSYTAPEKVYLTRSWYAQSEKIVMNREEDNIVY